MGYKMTSERDEALFCHSECRKRTLPDTRKLTGTKKSEDYQDIVSSQSKD